MSSEEVNLLSKLVSIDTTSTERKNYETFADLLMEETQKRGLTAEKVVDKKGKGIPHIIVTIPTAPKKAKKSFS